MKKPINGRYSETFIVGCGYTGKSLAQSIRPKIEKVTAVTNQSKIHIQGVKSVRINLDQVATSCLSIGKKSLIFYLVPPPNQGSIDTRIRNFLDRVILGLPRRLVLISTTGVYGNCSGNWIDESTRVNPDSSRAIRRLNSERFAQKWAESLGVELTIIRVAGIYGPQRIPVQRIKQGFVLPPKEDVGYTNRIHVDDLVQVCLAAARYEACGLFNAADGTPMRMNDYYKLVAEIWGLPAIVESSKPRDLEHISSMMWSFLRSSKRIDNRRIRLELGVDLLYPHPRLGLEAIHFNQSKC